MALPSRLFLGMLKDATAFGLSLLGAADAAAAKTLMDISLVGGLPDTSQSATLASARNLVLKYVTAATVDIDADRLVLFDGSGNGLVVNAVNLTADISASGANGRGTGVSETGNLWYYLWLGDGGGTPYAWFDISTTGANDPSASTYKGLVGMVRNDGSSNLKQFLQRGRKVSCAGEQVLSLGAATTATAMDMSAVVPPIAVAVELEVQPSASSGSATATVNLSSNASGTTAATDKRTVRAPATTTSAEFHLQTGMIAMSTAQQLYYWVQGANVRANINAVGWEL